MRNPLVLVCLVVCFCFAPGAYAQDRPNIVLVFMDNFGWGEPGFNGSQQFTLCQGQAVPSALAPIEMSKTSPVTVAVAGSQNNFTTAAMSSGW